MHGVLEGPSPPAGVLWTRPRIKALPFKTPALPNRKGELVHAAACSLVLGVRVRYAALQWLGGLHSRPYTSKGP